jgi:hypothetical protein
LQGRLEVAGRHLAAVPGEAAAVQVRAAGGQGAVDRVPLVEADGRKKPANFDEKIARNFGHKMAGKYREPATRFWREKSEARALCWPARKNENFEILFFVKKTTSDDFCSRMLEPVVTSAAKTSFSENELGD